MTTSRDKLIELAEQARAHPDPDKREVAVLIDGLLEDPLFEIALRAIDFLDRFGITPELLESFVIEWQHNRRD